MDLSSNVEVNVIKKTYTIPFCFEYSAHLQSGKICVGFSPFYESLWLTKDILLCCQKLPGKEEEKDISISPLHI